MINKVGHALSEPQERLANTKDKWFANRFSPVPSFRTRGRPRRQLMWTGPGLDP